LIAVAEQPYKEATQLARDLVTLVTIITAIALAVAVVAGLGMVRQIVLPIEKLSAGVQAVQAGDLSQTVDVTGKDEIGRLAQTFNAMTSQLQKTIVDLEQSQATFRNIIEAMPMGMYLYHLEPDNRLIFDGVNPAAQQMFAFASNELINQPIETTFPGLAETELPDQFRNVATGGQTWQTEFVYPAATDESALSQNIYQVYAFQTSSNNIVAAFLDVTESKQAEVERERLQQEVIEAQKQVIHELSTPVIPIMDHIIVMPLIGSIDTLRARDITRMLLAGISQRRAKVVILDVTGMPIVDTGVANHLSKTIQAARLKGARTIVTGISEAVAETIVDLGLDWSNIETLSDLQTGLVAALNGLGIKLTPTSQKK
jgi:PAS domain S-box-containing protein